MKSYKCVRVWCVVVFLYYVDCELGLSDGSLCVSQHLNGTCVSVYRCPTDAHAYIYRIAGYGDDAVPRVSEICSYKDRTPIVCCTDCLAHKEEVYKLDVVDINGELVKRVGPKALNKCLDYLQYLPYPCRGRAGVKIEKNIFEDQQCHIYVKNILPAVESKTTGPWDFPHMALLGFGTDPNTANWACGGSVISKKFILTAGHCVKSDSLGEVSFAALGLLKRSDPIENWKIYKIKRAIPHPEYKPPSKYHDIALLETDTEIKFSRILLPACLDTDGAWGYNKSMAYASGWRQQGNKDPLDTLEVVALTEFKPTECASAYPADEQMKHGYDNNTQICYGSHNSNVDTCQGDSGGPLQVDQMQCQYTVVGVTSFSKSCETLGSPGLYTRVSHYVPWIESIVWRD